MHLDHDLEYLNLAVWFNRKTLHAMLQALVEVGVNVTWKESPEKFHLLVKTTDGQTEWIMQKLNGSYRLHLAGVPVQDSRVAVILYRFVEQAKGHAVVKVSVDDESVLMKYIRYGEAVRIVEIKGAEKKVIYEKSCNVTMDQVIAALKRRDSEERIPVLRLELDYELATLFDALTQEDKTQVKRSTERLKQLRREMLLLEV
ncbi:MULTISPECIES: hypothetical protein [Brevibacillus]|uniref:Uncharacterized protein n=1 Tax=Brevibacillus invocatus TaxID=173959 RepID=A0A3M8CMJ5_9BACL|nr:MULTISPECIES: hypothetical protein [Brevibacillus]MCM3078396.1 hypothetical protein [Brevibacillus invocatus]MCM3428449.1 hypothetical protein [Brevibacillus invocatus]MDH4616818.1 hypothetical protein [Brevibacillus sp. AY1]RNB76095.1 hypothetical protein EDM52_04045 [Brevibacillus invocatus]